MPTIKELEDPERLRQFIEEVVNLSDHDVADDDIILPRIKPIDVTRPILNKNEIDALLR